MVFRSTLRYFSGLASGSPIPAAHLLWIAPGRGHEKTSCQTLMKITLPTKILSVALLGLALAAHADYSSTLSSLNPLGYWRLNEPTQPVVPTYPMTNIGSAGTVLNGTYYGVPTLGQPGALTSDPDSSAQFGTVSQYAEVPYNAAMNPPTSFTVEFWAKRTNSTTSTASVICNFGPGRSNGYLVFAGNGTLQWTFRTYNGTTRGTLLSNGTGALDVWTHVVCVHDGTGTGANYIYLDGVLDSSLTPAPYAPQTLSALRLAIGPNNEAPAWPFPGLLDDMAIYPTALTDAQVAAHYAAATSPTPPTPYRTLVLADGAAAYWRLDEATLPPYLAYPATNSGTLGTTLQGAYSTLGAVSGVAGPTRDQYAGFATNNRAVQLNSGSTAGRVTFPPVPGMITDRATITCWVKRAGTQVDTAPMFFNEAASGSAGLNFQYASPNLAYHWEDSSTTHWSWTSGLLVPDNLWTFVALVVTPTEAVMYMGSTNGLSSRTNVSAHAVHDFSLTPGVLGGQLSRTDRYLKGWLDEVALFDQALDYNAISNLFYSATPAIPLLTRTPANPVYEGVTVTFAATAVGTGPVSYQWRKNGSPIGANSPTLILNNVTIANNGNYDLVATVGSQSVTSAVEVITVVAGPPVVIVPPASVTRYAGGTVTLTVSAGGTAPLSYQWLKGGTPVAGATASAYLIQPLKLSDAGGYSVVVTNAYNSVTSSVGILTVLAVPGSYGPVVMGTQPNSYWRLNETSGTTAYDYAGGMNGTFPAPPAVVLGVNGPRPPQFAGFEAGNTAYQLDGVGGWVTAPPLNWNTNTVTFTAWVKLSAYDDDLSGVVFTRGDSATGIHILNNGELRYHWSDGQYGWSSGLTVPLNEWTLLALVVEPTRATLYMGTAGGLLSAVNTATHNPAPLSDPLYLGRDTTARPVAGLMDEVAIYKRSLSANEIGTLYGIGTGIPLVITMTSGGIIQDTKPVGTPNNGFNYGATWLASSGPDASFPAITRTGVEAFNTTNAAQITIPASTDFDSTTGTILFWMRANAPIPGPGNEAAMLFDRRTDNGTVITLDDAGAIFMQCSGGANSLATGYLPDNNWHLVAVTYDQSASGSISIYIDGTLAGFNPNTSAWSWPTTQGIELGRSHDGYWKRYDGQLDDFRIYSRVLTDVEIGQIYSSGALVDTAALKVRFNFSTVGTGETLAWPFGTLESSPTLGPTAVWTPVPGAASPWPILTTGQAMFYRVKL